MTSKDKQVKDEHLTSNDENTSAGPIGQALVLLMVAVTMFIGIRIVQSGAVAPIDPSIEDVLMLCYLFPMALFTVGVFKLRNALNPPQVAKDKP